MADNLISPEFRAAFISVFKATLPRDAKPDQKPKFSVRAAFPPTTDMSALKREAASIAREKWGDKRPQVPAQPVPSQ